MFGHKRIISNDSFVDLLIGQSIIFFVHYIDDNILTCSVVDSHFIGLKIAIKRLHVKPRRRLIGDGCAEDIGGVVMLVDGDLRAIGVGGQEESD